MSETLLWLCSMFNSGLPSVTLPSFKEARTGTPLHASHENLVSACSLVTRSFYMGRILQPQIDEYKISEKCHYPLTILCQNQNLFPKCKQSTTQKSRSTPSWIKMGEVQILQHCSGDLRSKSLIRGKNLMGSSIEK